MQQPVAPTVDEDVLAVPFVVLLDPKRAGVAVASALPHHEGDLGQAVAVDVADQDVGDRPLFGGFEQDRRAVGRNGAGAVHQHDELVGAVGVEVSRDGHLAPDDPAGNGAAAGAYALLGRKALPARAAAAEQAVVAARRRAARRGHAERPVRLHGCRRPVPCAPRCGYPQTCWGGQHDGGSTRRRAWAAGRGRRCRCRPRARRCRASGATCGRSGAGRWAVRTGRTRRPRPRRRAGRLRPGRSRRRWTGLCRSGARGRWGRSRCRSRWRRGSRAS